jgi:hypothetical protein
MYLLYSQKVRKARQKHKKERKLTKSVVNINRHIKFVGAGLVSALIQICGY